MITPGAVVTTFAESGATGTADGLLTSATFNSPVGVCIDASGNIYTVEDSNQRVRKISGSQVTIIAASNAIGFANATVTLASFNYPTGICVDPSGNIFIADQNNHAIRKITSAGVVSTFAGTGTSGAIDANGTAVSFDSPTGVSSDASGKILTFQNIRFIK